MEQLEGEVAGGEVVGAGHPEVDVPMPRAPEAQVAEPIDAVPMDENGAAESPSELQLEPVDEPTAPRG